MLDDAYIHLAIAKNFALHNIWGVTSHEFSSASSSPIFTYCLSVLICLFGNNDQYPLYLNVAISFFILYFLTKYYSGFLTKSNHIVIAVLFTVFFSVLHLLMLSGMEHSLHVLLIIINVFCLKNYLHERSHAIGFFVSLLIMGLVRFESMFYFAALIFSFLLIKKWKVAALVFLAGFIPIAVFCYFNYQQAGYLFPNSVVVKGTVLDLSSDIISQINEIFLNKILFNISFYKVGIFPIAMCAIFIYKDLKIQTIDEVIKKNFLLIVFSMLLLCHSLFADLKSGFRYEAYILAGLCMGLVPKVRQVFENFRRYITDEKLMSFLILMNVFLLFYKSAYAHLILINGGKNIYEQQIQSAKFLNAYYNTSKVVANDIGAITYYTDIQLLDIVGLGSSDMIPFSKGKKEFDDDFEVFIEKFSVDENYELAVIYEDWFDGHIPQSWIKVATLTITDKISVYGEEVSIYCINVNELDQLKKNIKSFHWNKNVNVKLFDKSSSP